MSDATPWYQNQGQNQFNYPAPTSAPTIQPEVTKDSPALKFDSDKESRPELIAPEMIEALGTILSFGAKKYHDRNWEKGMKWSRPFGALMRHLWAWWAGENLDKETNKSHLAHAACCLMFLLAYESRSVGSDDRKIVSG